MNSDNIHKLILLCQSMNKEGAKPSVGMLRSKAPFKVSVTEAIEAIKRYNASNPATLTQNDATKEAAAPQNLTARVEALEEEVASLKQALANLTQQTLR